METSQRVHFRSASNMAEVAGESVDLVVTSPPYPMIEMWDATFATQAPAFGHALERGDGRGAFEAAHEVLDAVWREVARVLVEGGIACVNVGDATRTIAERFALYANHARILETFAALGLSALPAILWRKPTNAPNKFMGSGMLPAGAYVTLEHEYVLVLRKGEKRTFVTDPEKARRRASAYFWEERNQWFSDVWFDLLGARQRAGGPSRERSGAFPFELSYRLVHMYSLQGDTVLDPFAGFGTTLFAAMAGARHGIGYEIDPGLESEIAGGAARTRSIANARGEERLARHLAFVRERIAAGRPPAHSSRVYGFPVITKQEVDLSFPRVAKVTRSGEGDFRVEYATEPLRAEVTTQLDCVDRISDLS